MQNRDQATKRLFDAINNNDVSKVKSALFDGADVNGTVKGINGPALFKAAFKGNLAIIKLLLEHNADIHGCVTNGTKDCYNGSGVIESAVEGKHTEVISFLLERGANPNQARKDGGTALLSAANNRSSAIVKILLENGANIEQFSTDKESALNIATERHDVNTVKLLVAHILAKFKNKPDELVIFLKTNDQFKTAITKAQDYKVSSELMNLIDALLEAGIDHADIRTLLPTEYSFKNTFVKENLLARIQALPANERIALCSKILTEPNHPYRVIFSLQRGSKPCQLGHGILKQVKTTMDTAIAKIAAVNQASSWYNGMTPLYYAAYKGHIEVAKKLILDGANCNPDNINENPLFAAAQHGNIDMVNLLVENGANPAASSKTTKQALWKLFHSQASFVKDALSNFLLRFPNNEVTITPADYAAIFGFADTADLFNALADQEPILAVAIPEASAPVATVAAVTEAQATNLQEQEDQEIAAAIKASLAPTEAEQASTVANSNNEPLQEYTPAAAVAPSHELHASEVELATVIPAPAATVTTPPESKLYQEAFAIMRSNTADFVAATTPVVTEQKASDVKVAEPAPVVGALAPVAVASAPIPAVATKVNVLDLLYADNNVSTLNAQPLQPAPVQIAKPAPVVVTQPVVGDLISLTAAPVTETTAVKPESETTLKLLSIFAVTPPSSTPAQPVATTAPQSDNLDWLDELEKLKAPTNSVKPVEEKPAEKKEKRQLLLG